MIKIETSLCTGCGRCARECPLNCITISEKIAIIGPGCSSCGVCARVCPSGAAQRLEESFPNTVTCTSCPVQCQIQEGYTGACQRYTNVGGRLLRNRPLVAKVEEPPARPHELEWPLITGVGAGTNYPCPRPAPYIVQGRRGDIEIVTVVTEAPLSYSGIKVKIDTNFYIGEEGAKVRRDGQVVGMVDTEEYGAKMLSIGGPNLLTGKSGFMVARTIVDIANGERVELKVDKGAKLEIQVGCHPVINGQEDTTMRVGCGSATIGLFARHLKGVVDEAIILDHHIIGLFSEHPAGQEVGMKYSGVIPNGRKSTRGRYFGEPGDGWGGTSISNPRDAIKEINMKIARPGMRILVTETTARRAALFEVLPDGEVKEIPVTPEVAKVIELIANTCEESRVSALYIGGVGGSARAGVTTLPLELTKAVHRGEITLTVGGAPTFILPGGGINFMVDVEKVVPKAFYWVPTPATVAPIEYTMEKKVYERIGGHVEYLRPVEEIWEMYPRGS
ncbi:6-hydroxynicotinate reductase [Thermanaeromonas toyohensis ToBE]|uniref:6-hydroxynicotinate reductase n=1 Tax=Thermanaeromonas toyohensis ToBE TaxID=698762 RepID=A0A1W1VJ58_9FIRM|nr:4Fe-4S dicluster domain-containing protein [Thermanaeromonas toyohensis]SMB93366.1 6-hydroxynicotinate reductase [Thermanaeromonas toyohensis ToBE]